MNLMHVLRRLAIPRSGMDACRLLAFFLVLPVIFLTAAPAARAELTEEEQKLVNQAIDKGADYLRHNQRGNSWAAPNQQQHVFGYTALPALVLIECGTPVADPIIQNAAQVIRQNAQLQGIDSTYEISLSILFLDRLGSPNRNPTDIAIIQSLAQRLMAGQKPNNGGWSYKCPLPGQNLQAQGPAPGFGGLAQPGFQPGIGRRGWGADPRTIAQMINNPAFQQQMQKQVNAAHPGGGDATDNSNTQFAILGLMAARQYCGNMLDPSLGLVVQRFQVSQNPTTGTWGYNFFVGGTDQQPGQQPPGVFVGRHFVHHSGIKPQMTAVGLLGLAVGLGLAPGAKAGNVKALDNPQVSSGFMALSNYVGDPVGHVDRMKQLPQPSLYYMWSLERVAVLYNFDKIGTKDWYRWGAEILVANQMGDGSWQIGGGYPGQSPVINTCLALLFLKRANLLKELTARLAFNPTELNGKIVEEAKKNPNIVSVNELLSATSIAEAGGPAPLPPMTNAATSAPPPPPPVTATPPAPATMAPPPPPQPEVKENAGATTAPPAVDPPRQPEPQSIGHQQSPNGLPNSANSHGAAPTADKSKSGKTGLYVLLGLGILLLIGGGVFIMMNLRGSGDDEEDDEDDRPRRVKKKPLKKMRR